MADTDASAGVAADVAGGAGDATPADGTAAGTDAATAIKDACDKGDRKGALKAATAMAAPLLKPSLGFPQVVANPDPVGVRAFQTMLATLSQGGTLGELGAVVARQEKALLASSGGRRPKDWYGPQETFTLLLQKFGTDDEKAEFAMGAGYVAPQEDGILDTAAVETPLSNGDARGATEAALAASSKLLTGGSGSPRLNPKPDPAAVKEFQNMLGNLESHNWLPYLSTALQQYQHDVRKGRSTPIPGASGPAATMNMLVDKYGTASQKATWKGAAAPAGPAAAQQVASLVAAGGPDMAKKVASVALSAAGSLFVAFDEMSPAHAPAVVDEPDPLAVENFRSFLDDVEANGNIDDLQQALAGADLPGGSPRQALQLLVTRFGTPHEIDVWALGGEDPFQTDARG
jgi:hypothetical protein